MIVYFALIPVKQSDLNFIPQAMTLCEGLVEVTVMIKPDFMPVLEMSTC